MPQELEHVAVDRVRARFGDGVDRGARVHAVLRRQRARLDLELLERVGKRQREIQVVVRIVVRRAVEQIRDAVRLAAGDREREPALRAAEAAARRVQLRLRDDRRQVLHEVGGISSVQRQLEDPLVVHHLADAHVARFDQRRFGLDEHRLFDRAERQLHVDHRIVVHPQHDAGPRVRLEPLKIHFQLVRTDRQARNRVRPGRVGERVAFEAGVGLRGDHIGARKNAAARVADDAGDLRRGAGLREGDRAGEKENAHAASDQAHHAHHEGPPERP